MLFSSKETTGPILFIFRQKKCIPEGDIYRLFTCSTGQKIRRDSSKICGKPWWGPMEAHLIGRPLAKFTQLKRNKRFDNFIMLVGVQGSLFHIAAGSHPVQEAWGSQDSLYRGQIQKLLQCCRDPYQQIPLVITIQKKV